MPATFTIKGNAKGAEQAAGETIGAIKKVVNEVHAQNRTILETARENIAATIREAEALEALEHGYREVAAAAVAGSTEQRAAMALASSAAARNAAQMLGSAKAASHFSTALANAGGAGKVLDRGLSNINGRLAGMQQSFLRTGGHALKLGGLMGVGLVGAAVAVGVKFDNMKQQATIAFTSMLHSGAKARKFLGDLYDFAARTPFRFQGITSASQRLLAMGFQAKEILPTLRAIGDAASALGAGQETMDRIALALGQMRNAAHVMGQDMNQLIQAGIPAWKYLADAAGKTIGQIRQDAQNGLISGAQASQTILAAMETQYKGMMERQSHTAAGLFSTIQDLGSQVLGRAVQPTFNFILKRLDNMVTGSDSAQKAANRLADAWGRRMLEGVKAMITFFKANWEGILKGLKDAGQFVLSLGRGFLWAARQVNHLVKILGGPEEALKQLLAAWVAFRLGVIGGMAAIRVASLITGASIMSIRTALIASGIGIALAALGLIAVEVITHWKAVKAWFVKFWEDMRIYAFEGVKTIVEPFSHLPGRLGNWARKAKVRMDDELWKIQGPAATSAAKKAAENWGRTFNLTIDPWLQDASDKIANIMNPLDPNASRPTKTPGGQYSAPRGAGLISPVPAGSSQGIIGTPGVGTHNQSDWQSRNAIDIKVAKNTPILAVEDGVITKVTVRGSAVVHTSSGKNLSGSSVTLRGGFNTYFYTHLANVSVRGGQHVKRGQVIGHAGALDHVHFAVETGSPTGFATLPGATAKPPKDKGSDTGGDTGGDTGAPDPLVDTTKVKTKTRKKPEPFRGMPTPGAGGGTVDQIAAKHHFRPMYGRTLVNYIASKAKQLGLDPAAVLAVATTEGGFQGKVGDDGTSFGPFQLHAGGALPANVWGQGPFYARAWANSQIGLDYALKKIADVVGSAKGAEAVTSQVIGFEHAGEDSPRTRAQARKATSRLGQTKFTIGSVQGGDTTVWEKTKQTITDRVEQAIQLQDLIKSAVENSVPSLEDLLGKIAGRKDAIANLGMSIEKALKFVTARREDITLPDFGIEGPAAAAIQNAQNKIKRILAAMKRATDQKLVDPAQMQKWRDQLLSLGETVNRGLTEASIRAEHATSRTMTAMRKQFTDKWLPDYLHGMGLPTLQEFDAETKRQLDGLRKAFDSRMRQFDKETQMGLQRFVVAETPAEAALKQFQDARQQQQRERNMQQLQQNLSTAIAGGDPDAIRQAQEAVNEALLDEQERGLDAAARQSREAQDLRTQQQQEAYQNERDDLRRHLEEQEQALEDSTQRERDIARTGIEGIIEDQTDKFEEDLDVWWAWLGERAAALDEFYAWAKRTYGIGPGQGPSLGRIEEGLKNEIVSRATHGVPMQTGGTILDNRFISRGDVIPARLAYGETVISETLTNKLDAALSGGGFSGGIQVVIPNAVLLGRDRDVARTIAELAAPEIERRISYRTTL